MLVAFHLPRLAVNEGKEMWDLCSVEHEISPRSVIGARKIVQMSHRHVDQIISPEINDDQENITRFENTHDRYIFRKKRPHCAGAPSGVKPTTHPSSSRHLQTPPAPDISPHPPPTFLLHPFSLRINSLISLSIFSLVIINGSFL